MRHLVKTLEAKPTAPEFGEPKIRMAKSSADQLTNRSLSIWLKSQKTLFSNSNSRQQINEVAQGQKEHPSLERAHTLDANVEIL